jgi:hypothetical protein
MNALTRNLKMTGAALDVPVRVLWPTEDKGGWDCRWEIVWPDRQRTNSGRGTDAIQAPLNALQMVGTEIYCSEGHRSGKLVGMTTGPVTASRYPATSAIC